jgi:hypothetical protein
MNILQLSGTSAWMSRTVIASLSLVIFYFIPSLSHQTGFPLYQYEPMRLLLFGAILLADKKTAYVVAVTLPVFSFITSSHPAFYKVFLIMTELLINVFAFFQFQRFTQNLFLATLFSILVSKSIYYILKYLFIKVALLPPGLISTPVITQFLIAVILSCLVYLTFRFKGKKP